jgi:hypothetical protein
LAFVHRGTDVDAGLHAVPDFQLLGLLDERGDKRTVYGFGHCGQYRCALARWRKRHEEFGKGDQFSALAFGLVDQPQSYFEIYRFVRAGLYLGDGDLDHNFSFSLDYLCESSYPSKLTPSIGRQDGRVFLTTKCL